MQQKEKDDLIVVVVNSGCDDAVMSAAKSAGARGGTILHGRRLGAEGEKPGGSGVRPEKDIGGDPGPQRIAPAHYGGSEPRGGDRHREPRRALLSAGG